MVHKPLFITFEGCEGAGKSTLIERVFAALTKRGVPLALTREPGGTVIGEKIRELLLKEASAVMPVCELFLFLAARAQHLDEVIAKNIALGTTVLCDRFSDSTIAYQGGGRNLGVDFVTKCNELCTKGRQPDLTLYVDIDPKLGLSRVQNRATTGFDRIENEKLHFHERVRDTFLLLAKRNPSRFVVLDGTLSKDELEELALKEIDKRWHQK
jgi:dTMP kinase